MRVIVKVEDWLEDELPPISNCGLCHERLAKFYLRRLGLKICDICKEKYCEEV